jgi:hypothetical protein
MRPRSAPSFSLTRREVVKGAIGLATLAGGSVLGGPDVAAAASRDRVAIIGAGAGGVAGIGNTRGGDEAAELFFHRPLNGLLTGKAGYLRRPCAAPFRIEAARSAATDVLDADPQLTSRFLRLARTACRMRLPHHRSSPGLGSQAAQWHRRTGDRRYRYSAVEATAAPAPG